MTADWKQLEADVVERIRVLRAVSENLDAPPEWREKVHQGLVMPNLRLLAEFCVNVKIEEDSED